MVGKVGVRRGLDFGSSSFFESSVARLRANLLSLLLGGPALAVPFVRPLLVLLFELFGTLEPLGITTRAVLFCFNVI